MESTRVSNPQKSSVEEDIDEADDPDANSIIAVSDDSGKIHCFLDGSYPIGDVTIPICGPAKALYKHDDIFFVYPQLDQADDASTMLDPVIVRLPFLNQRIVRDLARVTSSMRELMWYTMRVVKDMRGIWFGSDTQNGARELGPKWLRALEARQQDQFGREYPLQSFLLGRACSWLDASEEEPHAILDLTCLLATGRSSESLTDYLGSGEQMSDRVRFHFQ